MRTDTTTSLKKHVWEGIFHAFEGVWEHLGRTFKKGSKKDPLFMPYFSIFEFFFGNVGENRGGK